jgi:hypothetical protein
MKLITIIYKMTLFKNIMKIIKTNIYNRDWENKIQMSRIILKEKYYYKIYLINIYLYPGINKTSWHYLGLKIE